MLLDKFGNALNPRSKELLPQEFMSKSNSERATLEEQRRRGQWFSNYGPSVSNIGSMSGTLRKPLDTPPFMMLRQVAKESLIDRAIINRRVEDIKGLSRKVVVPGKQRGWRVVHKRFDDPNFDSSDANIQRRCREMEEMIDKPRRLYHKTFRDFLSVAVQEELILDRRAMILFKDNKGHPVDYYLVPGDTVLPVLYVLMPWMAKRGISNERVARMILSEEYSQKAGVSIDISDAAYVQEIDGQVVGAWREDEIDVEWTHPSGELNRWGFGSSVLEQSLQSTALLLNMFNFNKDMFRPGFPSRMLVLSGDYSAEGLSAFERQVLGQGGPGTPKSKMPVLPGPENMRAQVLDLSATPNDMQFEQFFRLMASIKCSFFGMHPSRINLSEMNPAGMVMTSGSATTEVSKTINEEGLYALLESNADWLTRTLIEPYYDDLILIFDGLYEESEAQILQSLQVESTWSTLNEIRARRNLPQLSDDEGGDVIKDGIWLQWVNMKKQEKAQQEAQQQYEQGDFGGQPGQPGQPPQGPDGQPPQGGAGAPDQQAAMMQAMQQAQQGGQQAQGGAPEQEGAPSPNQGQQPPQQGSEGEQQDQQAAQMLAAQQAQLQQGQTPEAQPEQGEEPQNPQAPTAPARKKGSPSIPTLTDDQLRTILASIGRPG